MKEIMMILVPSVAVPLGLALLLGVVCICRRNKAANSGTKSAMARGGGANTQNQVELNPMLAKAPVRTREFPMSNIRFLQELGEGAFGKVYKGDVLGYHGDQSVMRVAVKTLKENASQKVKTDFRREVDLMTDLKHTNIVCLLGVCVKEEPMCMLFEFMSYGDLHEYLIMHSPHSDVSASDDEGAQRILDHMDMMHIACQVAAGMEYLSGHHYVHRDLAARNILVGENMTIKISDFGLSRDIYASDYYRVQSKSLLPVRWMPPESILYGKFTVESDIWSFGVVLWEIYSYGLQPYYGYSNQEVIEMIRARQILPCSEDCPARIYALMVECWHEMPVRRPNFKEIHSRLKHWKIEMTGINHMPPPPALNAAQSHSGHSGHSSSTHNSGMSHHSSTGPSNNTTTTALTTNSMGPQVSVQQQPALHGHLQGAPRPPQQYYTQVPYGMPQHPANMNYRPPLAAGPYHHPMAAQPMPYFAHPPSYELYRKPSPPGSVTSHKSSSVPSSSSPASSTGNIRPHGPQPPVIPNNNNPNHVPNNRANGHHPHQQLQHPNNINSPTTDNLNVVNSMQKVPTSVASPTDLYIPETRTSEI